MANIILNIDECIIVPEWELILEFVTNSPGSTTFDPVVTSTNSADVKWDVGGVEILGDEVSLTLDGSNKDVKLYRRNGAEILYISSNSDNIVGIIDVSHIAFNNCTIFDFNTNPLFTQITFPTSPTAILSSINIHTSGFTGVLNISGYTTIDSLAIRAYSTLMTNLTVTSGTITGTVNNIRCYSANLTGTLDLSKFTQLSSNCDIMVHSNPNLNYITFPTLIITGKMQTLWANDCNIIGELDISMFDWSSTYNSQIEVSHNPNLSLLTLPSSITGNVRVVAAANCNLSSIDLSIFDTLNEYSTDFIFSNNPSLSSVTLPSSPTGKLKILKFSNCAISGVFDISMFDTIDEVTGVMYEFEGNSGLTELTLPTSILNTNGKLNVFNVTDTIYSGVLDLSMFQHGADYFRIDIANTTISGITLYSTLDGDIYRIDVSNTNVGVVDIKDLMIATSYYALLYFSNLSWTAAQTNEMLVNLSTNSVLSASPERDIKMDGNTPPDSSSGGFDGLAAKADLISKGFSIIGI